MTDNHSELGVVRQNRDGRRRYDETAKRALVEAALRPSTSLARLALEHGINANLFTVAQERRVRWRDRAIRHWTHEGCATRTSRPAAT
ncbi:transposase [Burkholderia multivorans]|nr:transposase [Burkholderia multivorans]